MRAAVFEGPGDLVVRDVPDPVCPPGGLLVDVAMCAVCGSDVRIVARGHHKIVPPMVLGHEVVGVVSASDTAEVEVGERVTVAPVIGCGRCRWCADGRPNRCPELRTMGYAFAGAFAERLAVPGEAVRQGNVQPIPAGVESSAAALTEPLACCINGQELVGLGVGDVVVVVGAGPIGLLHARLARAAGASTVIVVERDAGRRAQAEALGEELATAPEQASDRIAAATDGLGCDVAIVAAPSGEAQAEALAWLAPGGRASLFGGLPPDAPPVALDTNRVHYRELFVTGAHGSTPAQNRQALELLESGLVAVDGLITHRFGLDQAAEAVAAMARREALKSLIVMGPAGSDAAA